MNSSCLYDLNGYCELLKKQCKLNQKGCVLYGKVKMISLEDEKENEKNNTIKTEGPKNNQLKPSAGS